MSRRLVVVGADAAGLSGAAEARRADPDLEIVVLERGHDVSYAACGMPYWIGGSVGSADDLVAHSAAYFRERRDIQVRTGVEVVAVAPAERRVQTATGEAVRYDALLIATGAGPVRPDVPGARLEGVHVLRDLASARALDARLRAGATSALIVGMGPIGIEMAEALVARGLTVTVIGRSPRPLTRLARTPAGMVADAAAAAGVELRTPARLEGIEPDGDGLRVTVDGAAQTYSLVLFGTGVAPRAGLARAAGCALGPGGAVLVDRRGRTSVDGVWAAGDCATAWHRVLGRDVWIPLATTANRQGRVAGRDIAGLPARFPGVLGSWMSTAFGVGLGGTGLTEEAARGAGFSPRAIEREGRDRSGYVEGAERLWVRLVWDGPTGRLLGGQIGGRAPVGGRLHALSVAVGAELTVRELAEMDLGYVPPLSALRDPLQLAAAAVVGDAP